MIMDNLGLVSIIMPVYNVEKYLSQCLESVCNQTYPYLEIIVVDDESPDNSGNIADDYAKKDDRVKVFHIKNRGAAGARNFGLDNCTGDYIFFVDSDDWIEKDAIESMIEKMNSNNCDMVLCQYYDEHTDKSVEHKFLENSFVCTDEEFVKDMVKKWEYILNSNKIYKADAIKNIRFVEGRCIDDEFFTYKAVLNMDRVYICNEYLYHYRMRKSSAMGDVTKQNQRHIDQVDFVTERYEPLSKAYPKLIPVLLEHLAEVLMSVMHNSGNIEETRLYAKSKLKEYFWKIISNKNVSLNIKKSVIMYLFKKNTQVITQNKVGNLQEDYFD